MKVFAVSDMHGALDGLDPAGCDIAVIAGDFAEHAGGGKWGVRSQVKWVNDTFVPWIAKYPSVDFVIVPGNHDFCMDPGRQAAWQGVGWRVRWPANAHILVDREEEIRGLRFYGAPWVPIISMDWAFEAEHDRLVSKFSSIPAGIDVLVTHTPPRIPGMLVDVSLDYGEDSEAFGSSELAQAVSMKRPRYLFCGHIHSGDHSKGLTFESTEIRNVSYVNERYAPAYDPCVMEIEPCGRR